ncbi:hypothetical protein KCP69_04610 [Salmonella enterica subsp. enterica]|nr:hypothetical protein KCP69_04610 [Salmonella enterica subsp. enterica]
MPTALCSDDTWRCRRNPFYGSICSRRYYPRSPVGTKKFGADRAICARRVRQLRRAALAIEATGTVIQNP